jgi:sugar phosphate isomerase/epimerase
MDYAVSNIALTAFDHLEELPLVAGLGIVGLEIAPSRIWRDTWQGLSPADIEAYRRAIEGAGLEAVGLHSLFFDHADLGLFRDPVGRAKSLDFLVHLSSVCRDLGGKTLIWGGGRQRGEVGPEDAFAESVAFMSDLCVRISGHGTVFCFEPLGPQSTDFINTAKDSLDIVRAVDHRALAVQLDAKALFQNDEVTLEPFEAVADRLVHFHANEPDLGVLGTSGDINHAAMGEFLRTVGYDRYVSIEQRQLDTGMPIENISKSLELLKRCYG